MIFMFFSFLFDSFELRKTNVNAYVALANSYIIGLTSGLNIIINLLIQIELWLHLFSVTTTICSILFRNCRPAKKYFSFPIYSYTSLQEKNIMPYLKRALVSFIFSLYIYMVCIPSLEGWFFLYAFVFVLRRLL